MGAPSRMTRTPLLRPPVSGGNIGSFLTALGVAGGGADPQERDGDLDADPDDDDDGAIRRSIYKLSCRRDTEGAAGGGIPNTW
jgi:hypothetical protein